MNRQQQHRCAIYTRKSSEEGLDQDFNSLHAQREACEAYIRSQHHEGWCLHADSYDDGGYSGGSMERPALRRLLAAIRDRCIDVVVVYKVDRLTRSLADFAKMVELFDEYDVSFVSVTQQFNTTSSMGRLTLNVLLSFAQFEREVTGERIRDKIAASKRRGMWMGGNVPLGYDAIDRKLVVNEQEAKRVRWLFQQYLELGSVRELRTKATQCGVKPKRRAHTNGKTATSPSFSRGHLYRILQNPVYIGLTRHKTETFPGEHAPIIDRSIWDYVQTRLATKRIRRRCQTNSRNPSLLTGLLFDHRSSRYSPSHAVKQGKRYRYYVAQADAKAGLCEPAPRKRLPAIEIEQVVMQSLGGLLANPKRLLQTCNVHALSAAQTTTVLRSAERLSHHLKQSDPGKQRRLVDALVDRVVIEDDAIALQLRQNGLKDSLGIAEAVAPDPDTVAMIRVPVKLRARGAEIKLVIEDNNLTERKPDPALLKSIARAHAWFGALQSGRFNSIGEIAEIEGVTGSYLTRIMRFAFLAPDITNAILDGTQPIDLTAKKLFRMKSLPLDWQEQRRVLGFDAA